MFHTHRHPYLVQLEKESSKATGVSFSFLEYILCILHGNEIMELVGNPGVDPARAFAVVGGQTCIRVAQSRGFIIS